MHWFNGHHTFFTNFNHFFGFRSRESLFTPWVPTWHMPVVRASILLVHNTREYGFMGNRIARLPITYQVFPVMCVRPRRVFGMWIPRPFFLWFAEHDKCDFIQTASLNHTSKHCRLTLYCSYSCIRKGFVHVNFCNAGIRCISCLSF